MTNCKSKNCLGKWRICTGIALTLFAGLLWLVSAVDVQPIGPNGSEVGLASINGAVRDFFGVNMLWYDVTGYLGMATIATAGGFVLLGLLQLIRRRSLKAVDADILLLGGLYAAVIAAYAVFEVVVVNCRPILMDGQLEASFPSTHTMLVLSVMGSAICQAFARVKSPLLRRVAIAACGLIMLVMVAGRLASGVHWFTDILGGLLLSCVLLSAYIGLCSAAKRRE